MHTPEPSLRMTPDEARRFVDAHRATIARVIAALNRRLDLDPDDAALMSEWIDRALTADDYVIVRAYRGDASFSTYLFAVVARLFREFRRSIDATSPRRAEILLARWLASSTGFRRAPHVQLHGVRVLACGVVVGTADLQSLHGMTSAVLHLADAGRVVESAARALRDRLTGTSFWPAARDDFSECLAADWCGPALGLETAYGVAIPAASVVVVAGTSPDGRDPPSVVIDFRLAGGAMGARLEPLSRGGGHEQERPAA